MMSYKRYLINAKATLRDALLALNQLSADVLTLFVIDDELVVGTLTDGDMRRSLIAGATLDDELSVAMNRSFKSLKEGEVDLDLIRWCRDHAICLLPVLNAKGNLVRVINLKQQKTMLPVEAVLMAGGKGERLMPLTLNCPKPLLPLGNKPIIDYNIEQLLQVGIDDIHVTTNYLADQIETHFAEPFSGVQVKCVREPRFLGTAGALKLVHLVKKDTILLMNSDLFTNIDYEDFYINFVQSGADMAVAAIPYSFTIPYGVFELQEETVLGVAEKPTHNFYANAGIYLFKREYLSMIPNDTFFNATDLMQELISKGKKVIKFPITGFWIDIGKPADYAKAQELVKHMR